MPRKDAKFLKSTARFGPYREYDPFDQSIISEGHTQHPVYRRIGPITNDEPHTSDQSFGNWNRGLLKRVTFGVEVDKKILDQFRSFVYNYVKARFKPLPHIQLSHKFLDSWLDDSYYTVRQKKMYHKELDNYFDHTKNQRKMFDVNSFIKREFYGEFKEPRTINAPSERLKCVTAPYIKLIEKQVYDHHFIKHCTRQDVCSRMRRIEDNYNLLYETDYSSFEGTLSTALMQACEMALFRRLLAENQEILSLIHMVDLRQRNLMCTFGHNHGKVKLKGSRLSGCMWTSLGNGFTNQMVIEFIRHKTEKRKHLGINIDYLVEGDDGLIGSTVQLDMDVAEKLGLKLKLVRGNSGNDLSFCGLCVGPQGLMPASFKRVVDKFGLTVNADVLREDKWNTTYTLRRCDELMRAKAMCLLVSNKAVPILQTLAMKVLHLTEDVTVMKKDFNPYWELEMQNVLNESLQPIPVNVESREFFAERFGISIDDQIYYEEMISKMTNLNTLMEIW